METRKSKYYHELSGDMKIRYDEKILRCSGIDPYLLKEKELSDNKCDFPEITLIDIANHMIHSFSPFTKKQFKNYKGMEAYSYFESGFVLNIGSRKLDDTAILYGRVRHSQRINEPALKVWILAKMSGEIICAHCTCLAGLSETCSHVGAICYAVLNVSESSETTSATDVLCKWNVPKLKNASMSRVADINWRSSTNERPHSSDPDASFVEHLNSIKPFNDEDIISFINAIHSDGTEPALRTILFPEERRRSSTISDEVFLTNLYSKDHSNRSLDELVEIGKSIKLEISKEDIAEITRVTLPQRKSKFWFALKRGRITGSNLKECCVTNIENPSVTAISRVITPFKGMDHIPSIKYGIKNKKKAIKQYRVEASSDHENIEYVACGLIFNQKLPFFTDSSDGIVCCDCHGKGCLVVKCLKVLEAESIDVLTKKPNNVLNKFGERYHLEKNHEFYYKAQMNIYLSESNYCDFLLWSSTKTLLLRIDRDDEFWETASNKALTFHEVVIMPELLSKFFTKKTSSIIYVILLQIITVFFVESRQSSDDRRDEYLTEEYLELVDLEIEVLSSEY